MICTDDTAGVITSPTSGLVFTEVGATARFSLALTSEPTSSVTIGMNSSDATESSLGNVSYIAFTTGSWSTPQTVTITGMNDDVVDGNISFFVVLGAAKSDDSNYNGFDCGNISATTKDGKS